MNLPEINEWLTLIANLGVIVGLVFLAVQVHQSNRIARYSAENARRTQFLEIANIRIENPDVLAKLKEAQPVLTPVEEVQALYVAPQHLNTWADAEAAHNCGLLTDSTIAEVYRDISVSLEEAPRLTTYFEHILGAYQPDNTSQSVVSYLDKKLKKLKESSTNND